MKNNYSSESINLESGTLTIHPITTAEDELLTLGAISNFGNMFITEGVIQTLKISNVPTTTIQVGDLILTGDIEQYTPRTQEFFALNGVTVEGSKEGVLFTTQSANSFKFLTVSKANEFVKQREEQDNKAIAPKLTP